MLEDRVHHIAARQDQHARHWRRTGDLSRLVVALFDVGDRARFENELSGRPSALPHHRANPSGADLRRSNRRQDMASLSEAVGYLR